MSARDSESTLSGAVLARVRADILRGDIRPGTRLRLTALCQQHDVSLSVVREALTRLSEQGLVVSEPQVGFRVIELSLPDLVDLVTTRGEIEGLALRHAVIHGDVEWESTVVASHHRLQRCSDDLGGGEGEAWEGAHAEFHRALISGCGRPRLLDLTRSLWDASEFYRRWSTALPSSRDVAGEHAALLAAVLERNAYLSVRLLTEHIARTSAVLVAGLAGAPAGTTADPSGE